MTSERTRPPASSAMARARVRRGCRGGGDHFGLARAPTCSTGLEPLVHKSSSCRVADLKRVLREIPVGMPWVPKDQVSDGSRRPALEEIVDEDKVQGRLGHLLPTDHHRADVHPRTGKGATPVKVWGDRRLIGVVRESGGQPRRRADRRWGQRWRVKTPSCTWWAITSGPATRPVVRARPGGSCQAEDSAVSAVQITRENLLPRYGAVAGRRVADAQGVVP